ncbi:hypothetical protein YC2023_101118 [Brassica napus]
MEKEEFLRSGHGREERNEEMRKLDSDQEHDHIIRSKRRVLTCVTATTIIMRKKVVFFGKTEKVTTMHRIYKAYISNQ